jgi:hypothetical protein
MIKRIWAWLTAPKLSCDYIGCRYYEPPVSQCPNGHRLPPGVNGEPTSPRPYVGKPHGDAADTYNQKEAARDPR